MTARMFRRSISLCFFWTTAGIASLAMSAWTAPWILDVVETARASPLPYEGAMRIYLLVSALNLLTLSGVWILVSRRPRALGIWACMAAFTAILSGIFLFDTSHKLMEEFSWIRYPTALLLACAGCVSAWCIRWERARLERSWMKRAFWSLLSAGFFFTAADEIFEVHEKIGRSITQLLHASFSLTDYVTLIYALLALAGITVAILYAHRRIDDLPTSSLILFFLGVFFYTLSTGLDTIDIFVKDALRSLATILSMDASFIFSDAWYLLYHPRDLLNGIEEILEGLAALLFLVSLVLAIIEQRSHIADTFAPRRWHRWTSGVILATWVLGTSALVYASLPLTVPRAPLLAPSDMSLHRIAGPLDGLFHSDDLDFHPTWGVAIGNEGKGNILLLKNDHLTRVPDPQRIVRDADTVAVTHDAVIVADGSQKQIARFTHKEGWDILWSKADELKHPEALAVRGSTLYVIDDERTIKKLVNGKQPISWTPDHAEINQLEGIALIPKTDDLLITDDKSGSVFRAAFGSSIERIAHMAHPEDIAIRADGRTFITDNGWGRVVELDGRTNMLTTRVSFRRCYRDLQGIAIDGNDRLYVITADSIGSASFMPSFLFRIEGLIEDTL